MEREEKISTILIALDDNAILRMVLRTILKDAVERLDDERLDLIYYTINPQSVE